MESTKHPKMAIPNVDFHFHAHTRLRTVPCCLLQKLVVVQKIPTPESQVATGPVQSRATSLARGCIGGLVRCVRWALKLNMSHELRRYRTDKARRAFQDIPCGVPCGKIHRPSPIACPEGFCACSPENRYKYFGKSGMPSARRPELFQIEGCMFSVGQTWCSSSTKRLP